MSTRCDSGYKVERAVPVENNTPPGMSGLSEPEYQLNTDLWFEYSPTVLTQLLN